MTYANDPWIEELLNIPLEWSKRKYHQMWDKAEEKGIISSEASLWHMVFGNDLWLYCESFVSKGAETTFFLILQWVGSTLPQYCVPSAYAGRLSLTAALFRCSKHVAVFMFYL